MRNFTKISHSILVFSLCFGLFFGVVLSPLQAQAGFFSGILGDQALADTPTTDVAPSSPDTQKNSQTMVLLQANVSSASIFQDKSEKTSSKDKKTTKDTSKDTNKDSPINTNVDVNIIADNAMLPAIGPLGVSDGTDLSDDSVDSSVYVVRKGDTVGTIADMFGVSVNTILVANDMKKGEKLTEGQVLLILPISGIEHTVIKGQTLKSIAKLYKIDIADIALYNGLAQDDKLAVGDKLIIPGGDNMSDEGGDKPAPNLGTAVVRDQNYYVSHPLQNLLGYFINPAPIGHKTQGLHGPGHRGIDIGLPNGSSLYASASGTVILTKNGCKVKQSRCGGGYGNMIILQHENGTKTLYGHMTKVTVQNGDRVSRGEVIGLSGNTGRSTGPHLHFEVFNAKNPGSDWSWAN